MNFLFSPDLSWTNIGQWDSDSENVGAQSRIRWEFSPGQIMYLVYHRGFRTGEDLTTNSVNTVAVKGGFTFRF